VAWKLLPVVGAVNARQAWREHITSLLESALIRNDAVLEQVSAAMATAIEAGCYAKLSPPDTSPKSGAASTGLRSPLNTRSS